MLVSKTRDDADDFGGGASEEMTAAQAADYLNGDPRHAVVLSTPHGPRYIIRGAGEGHNDFYWGDMPAEDPNDAAGGDLTAAEAIEAAQTESLDRGQLAEECCQQLRGIVPEEVLEQVRQAAPWMFNRG